MNNSIVIILMCMVTMMNAKIISDVQEITVTMHPAFNQPLLNQEDLEMIAVHDQVEDDDREISYQPQCEKYVERIIYCVCCSIVTIIASGVFYSQIAQ